MEHTQQKHEEKICAGCGKTFICKSGDILKCQCYGIELTAQQQNGFAEKEWQIVHKKVIDTIKQLGDNYSYYLVVVNKANYTPPELLGRGNLVATNPKDFRFVLILSQPHIGAIRTFTNTVGHELGHWLGLPHTFTSNSRIPIVVESSIGNTKDNFMDYNIKRKKWLKIQLLNYIR
jgi:hypothetical protein